MQAAAGALWGGPLGVERWVHTPWGAAEGGGCRPRPLLGAPHRGPAALQHGLRRALFSPVPSVLTYLLPT